MIKIKYFVYLFFIFLCLSSPLRESQAVFSLPPMEYRELCEKPGVCKKLSRLILGTDHLGKVPNQQTVAVLNEAVKLGINAFDTAPIYTDGIERRLGSWLKSQKRSDLYVITKGGFPHDLGPGTYQSRLKGSQTEITAQVLEEIQKSKLSYDHKIDIYLMHRDDLDFQNYTQVQRPQTPVQTILKALSAPVLRNDFAMLGVSNWATSRVDESQRVAAAHPDLLRPVCNSPYFSLLEMGSTTIHSGGVQVKHAEMLNPAFQKGVKLMTYSPLGGFSIFSKGWEPAKQKAWALKQKKDRYWGHVYDALFHPANQKRYQRAEAFTRQFNQKHQTHYTLDQMANAYVLAHPRTNYLIIGPRTLEQLRRTVQALALAKMLSQEDLDYLYQNP
jgi:aryl-alcohol dehydrogenase-like predicted oxidoreductase